MLGEDFECGTFVLSEPLEAGSGIIAILLTFDLNNHCLSGDSYAT